MYYILFLCTPSQSCKKLPMIPLRVARYSLRMCGNVFIYSLVSSRRSVRVLKFLSHVLLQNNNNYNYFRELYSFGNVFLSITVTRFINITNYIENRESSKSSRAKYGTSEKYARALLIIAHAQNIQLGSRFLYVGGTVQMFCGCAGVWLRKIAGNVFALSSFLCYIVSNTVSIYEKLFI